MTLYTNHTRHSSVLTVKVVAANDLKSALKVGPPGLTVPHGIDWGYNDIVVPAGESVEFTDGAEIAFVSVRAEN